MARGRGRKPGAGVFYILISLPLGSTDFQNDLISYTCTVKP